MAKRDRDLTKTERAQAAIKEQEAAERRRKMMVVGSIVAVLTIVIGLVALWMSLKAKEKVDSAATPNGATSSFGLLIGDEAKAKHKVVIYEDFLCPACGQFEAASRDKLAEAAAAGKTTVEYRPFHLLRPYDYSQRSVNAFWVVLHESGPEVAKKFHDLLYENQPTEQGPQPDDAWLIEKAVEAGADKAAVQKGIEDLQFEGFVARSDDAASREKITGTPTIRVDGKDMAAADYETMVANIMAEIEK